MEPAHEKLNWIRLPDPLTEEEVRIQITWTANARTELAIRRQAKLMGFATPTDYLLQALAAVIAGNEEALPTPGASCAAATARTA